MNITSLIEFFATYHIHDQKSGTNPSRNTKTHLRIWPLPIGDISYVSSTDQTLFYAEAKETSIKIILAHALLKCTTIQAIANKQRLARQKNTMQQISATTKLNLRLPYKKHQNYGNKSFPAHVSHPAPILAFHILINIVDCMD